MLSLGSETARLCEGITRREMLRVGGLSLLGLSLPTLLRNQARAATASTVQGASFGRAKSCIILFMGGGPPQHETFDPKPDAPLEIRGEFRPIRTKVPGVHFCELLPHTAQIADRITVIRSMTTDVNSHSASGYWMLTGYPHPAGQAETPAGPDDWPSLAAVVGQMKPSQRSPISSVVLPEPIVNNPAIPWPGQGGGLMGPTWNPLLFKCDPSSADFHIDGMNLPDGVTQLRLSQRTSLLKQLDQHFIQVARSEQINAVDRVQQQAFDVVQSGATRAAFEMERESQAVRDRYGRHKFGQSVLLARRMIEAGVRLVQVNWPREPGDTTANNPMWDTHSKNAERVRNVLCPVFDGTFATLIEDMHQRGLLDETLVVVMGEFGRSPKINADGGRDHWGHCFSIAVAGAGIGGGQVIGASDQQGAYPISRPIRPQDLAATIFHLLGINPAGEFVDLLGPSPVADEQRHTHSRTGRRV